MFKNFVASQAIAAQSAWSGSLLLGFVAAAFLFRELAQSVTDPRSLSIGRERAKLRRVRGLFREIEETLASGVVPSPARWDSLRELPAPWGSLAHESVTELRSQGGAVLPTLRRLRLLAEEQDVALSEAKSRSAQALGQAVVCVMLVPLFSGALYLLLPNVGARPWAWLACTLGALGVATFGAGWILKLALVARWGGLRGEERGWVLSAQCAGERFLALLRTGNPPDSSWIRSCEALAREAPGLAMAWGASVWAEGGARVRTTRAAEPLWEAGRELKKAVQVSLMEGRPCSERIEAALTGLRLELKGSREREMGLLASRAMKPLFLCLAPALLGLLAMGVFFAWQGGGADEWL